MPVMRFRRSSPLVSRLTATVLVAAGLTVAPVAGGGPAVAAPPATAARPDPAVDYLVGRYDMTRQEALRSLGQQEAVHALQADLDARLGDAYGGVWTDQSKKGKVYVGVRPGQHPVAAAAAARAGVTATVVTVPRDLRSLRLARSRVLASGGSDVVDTTIDPSRGSVRVLVNPGTAVARRTVLERTTPGLVQVGVSPVRLGGATAACRFVVGGYYSMGTSFCDSPLRGGVGITNAATPQKYCTAGFTARSRSDDKLFLLTAGHCKSPSGNSWSTRDSRGVVVPIGATHNAIADSRGDAMLIAIANPGYWSPKPWVFVTDGSGTNYNETYRISAVTATSRGDTVCATGRRDGTVCGTVEDSDVHGAGDVAHVAQVSGGCIRGGDSGGPVYKAGYAYGLVHGGVFPTDENGHADTNYCAVKWWYQGIVGAQNLMRVDILR